MEESGRERREPLLVCQGELLYGHRRDFSMTVEDGGQLDRRVVFRSRDDVLVETSFFRKKPLLL